MLGPSSTLTELAGLGFLSLIAAYLKPRTRLAIAAALAVPQIWFPHVRLPLDEMWMLALGPAALLTLKRARQRCVGLGALLLLAALHFASRFWSPDRSEARVIAFEVLMFAGTLWTAAQVGRRRSDILYCLAVATPFIVTEAVLTIVFRLNSNIETGFLKSSFGKIFLGDSGQRLFTDSPNNVLDPNKAGGFFVNGNVASMFLGVCMMLLFVAWLQERKRLWAIAAFICAVAVVMTGSKTGTILIVALPATGTLIGGLLGRRRSLAFPTLLVVGTPIAAVAAIAAQGWITEFSTKASSSYGTRTELWGLAAQLFRTSPIVGLGHGGWVLSEQGSLGSQALPPHNLLVRAWADLGMLGVALTIWFIAAILRLCVTAVRSSTEATDISSAVACTLAWLWILIHGMADNTTIYGEVHTLLFAAFATALLQGISTETGDQDATATRSPIEVAVN